MTISLSLATFYRPSSLFAFYSFLHHVHIRHRRNYNEQMALVMVQAARSALPIKCEGYYYANVCRKLR